MKKTMASSKVSRRGILKGTVAAAALIAAPAIVGRAPISSAKAAFEGEGLIAVSWSGNYEQVFKQTVIDPFNEKYKTKAETVGGWDQMVSQIKAAPADNPPFDIIVAEEYISSAGLAENLYLKTDKSKIPNLEAVYPWFYETARPGAVGDYGVPFGGGTTMFLGRKSSGLEGKSWNELWDARAANKVTMDSAAWWWSLSVPAVLDTKDAGLGEMYDIATAEALFAKLEKCKVKKWFKDGAEQANLLNQDEVDVAMSYSSDALTFLEQQPGEYAATVPQEGTSAWADFYYKIRGTKHTDLADLFMNYLLEKETQDRFLSKSLIFMARKDVAVPAHWGSNYPTSNEAYGKTFQILTMAGWEKINASWDAYDGRMKKVIAATGAG